MRTTAVSALLALVAVQQAAANVSTLDKALPSTYAKTISTGKG